MAGCAGAILIEAAKGELEKKSQNVSFCLVGGKSCTNPARGRRKEKKETIRTYPAVRDGHRVQGVSSQDKKKKKRNKIEEE